MRSPIIYRHWQPGDDDAVLELLLPGEQVSKDYYQKKFDSSYVDAEGIRLALVNERGCWACIWLMDFILH